MQGNADGYFVKNLESEPIPILTPPSSPPPPASPPTPALALPRKFDKRQLGGAIPLFDSPHTRGRASSSQARRLSGCSAMGAHRPWEPGAGGSSPSTQTIISLRWSNGEDVGLSSRRKGFDSPAERHLRGSRTLSGQVPGAVDAVDQRVRVPCEPPPRLASLVPVSAPGLFERGASPLLGGLHPPIAFSYPSGARLSLASRQKTWGVTQTVKRPG